MTQSKYNTVKAKSVENVFDKLNEYKISCKFKDKIGKVELAKTKSAFLVDLELLKKSLKITLSSMFNIIDSNVSSAYIKELSKDNKNVIEPVTDSSHSTTTRSNTVIDENTKSEFQNFTLCNNIAIPKGDDYVQEKTVPKLVEYRQITNTS